MLTKYSEILKNNRYVIFYTLTERIFFFLTFLIIARKFSPDIYGQLITVFSLANIFIIIFDLGLPVLMQKEVAMSGKNSSAIVSDVLIIFAISLPFYLISSFLYCIIFFPEIPVALISIILLSVYFFSAGNLINKLLSGRNDFKSQFTVIIKARLPALILLITAALIFDAGMNIFLMIILSSAMLQIWLILPEIKKHNIEISFRGFRIVKALALIKLSLPLGLAVIFNFLYDKIDILLISGFTNFDQAAYYSVAYGIYKSSLVFFSFLFVSGFTEVSSFARDKTSVKLYFRKYSVMLIFVCIVLSVILYSFSGLIIPLIYTDKFKDSELILRILSFALTGLALNNLTGIMLNGMGFFNENMKVTLTGLILNVILNIIFIPLYGIVASAVITVLTEYYIFAGDYFYLNKFYKSA